MSTEYQQSYQRALTGLVALTLGAVAWSVLSASAAPLSSKRGFADTGASYNYLQAINAGWYYRWGPTKANIGGFDAKFVPMFWNGGQANQNNIDTIIGYGDVEWVLGFNEPERSDQANMSVGSAISAWYTLDAGFAGTGIKLISPGVSDTTDGWNWLSSFVSQANSQGLQLDAVAFHWYGVSNPNDPVGAANSFIGRVDAYHSSMGKPVWITEFAIHDWGGAYTDEEIRAANAIFLENVVPRLESRSYVIGYAFYHWFGDARLVEGSPLLPTNVGIPYVGTIRGGESYNFANVDFGEHVAYLAGGELTLNGTPGLLKFLNALSYTNTIAGTSDWSIDDGWVRVQPNAVLKKIGTNEVSWDDLSITNNGTIDVQGGALRLSRNSTYAGAGQLRIKPNGELNYYGRGSDYELEHEIELLGGTLSSTFGGGFVIPGGSVFDGFGTITSPLRLASGALLQVGKAGLPTVPSQFVIDNFESYDTGAVRDVADPPWIAHSGTGFAAIELVSGRDQGLTFGWNSTFRGVSRPLPEDAVVADDDVATIFFRFNSSTDDPDHSLGLSDDVHTDAVLFDDFEVQIRLASDAVGGSHSYGLDARNGGGFIDLSEGLVTNSWYNVWLVIDQTNDTFDVYLNSSSADATAINKLNSTPLAFRHGTSDDLDTFLGLAGSAPVDFGVQIDDITYMRGADLTNPLGGLNPVDEYQAASLALASDLTLDPGATLEIGIATPATHDVLSVAGVLNADGVLDLPLAASAPQPQSGDVFDIIDALLISGGFEQILLDPLPNNTFWDLRKLYSAGELSVLSSVDALENSVGCFSGPDNALSGGCVSEDLDGDNDNDLHDFAGVQDCVLDVSGVIPADCP